jgi:hypothetical protein
MEIDRKVVATVRKLFCDPDVVCDSSEAPAAWGDDQLVDVGIAFDDWCGVRLDDVRDVGVWIVPPEGAEQRRREYYVAQRAQPDEQNPHYSLSTVASSISITGMSSLMG